MTTEKAEHHSFSWRMNLDLMIKGYILSNLRNISNLDLLYQSNIKPEFYLYYYTLKLYLTYYYYYYYYNTIYYTI